MPGLGKGNLKKGKGGGIIIIGLRGGIPGLGGLFGQGMFGRKRK